MIGLFLALQIGAAAAAAPIPTFIIVRDGVATTSVPVTISGGEPSVRADALMRAMRGTLITGTNLHYTLALPRVRLDLIDGIPFAKRDTLTIPLTRSPQVRGGQLYLPFQFVSEVIPRYGGGYLYDGVLAELRTSAPLVQNAPQIRTPPSSTAVVTVATPVRGSATTVASGVRPAASESVRTPTPRPRPPTVSKPVTRKLVVIDAGHGGPDNGMRGPIGGPA